MADTYYVSTTGDNTNDGETEATPWLTLEYAAANIDSEDTVKIGDGTYVLAAPVVIPAATINTIWEGQSADKTKVTIQRTNNTAFDLYETDGTDKTTFKHLTIKQDSSLSTTYCIFAGKGSKATMGNVHAMDCDFHGKDYAVSTIGPLSKFERCTFTRTAGGSGGKIFALRFTEGGVDIDSCLFYGWFDMAIYATVGTGVTIRNCTIIGHPTSTDGDPGIRVGTGVTIYNTIVYSYAAAQLDYGIRINSADATNTIKNCIVFGTYSSAEYSGTGAPTVSAQLEGQTEVTADGNPVFVDLAGGDYHPDTSGLAYHRGDAASYPATDLNGNPFNNPPSIGCLEDVPAGGGGTTNSVVKSMGGGLLSSPFTLTP